MFVTLSALYILFLQTTSGNDVSASPDGLSLHWITDTTMEIQFPDTSTSTISLSPPTDPIDPDTPCLYIGRLDTEEDSQVVVVGCKDSQEDTQVIIKNNKIRGGLVSLVLRDGVTHILSLEDLVNGGNKREKRDAGKIDDDVLIPPESEMQSDIKRFTGPLPKAVILETDMYYDNTLLKKFNNNHKSVRQWLSKIFENTKLMMLNTDLVISVHLMKRNVYHLNDSINAQPKHLHRLAKLGYQNVGSFFCYNLCKKKLNECTLGKAFISTACNTNGWGININEYFNDKANGLLTSFVWARELGHNLGMQRDYHESHGGPNNPCVGDGIMTSLKNGWGSCNNKDFENMYRNTGHTCLRNYEDVLTYTGKLGDWASEPTFCPSGSFVYGFRVRTDSSQDDGDYTALNDIELFCRKPGSLSVTKMIKSSHMNLGDWGNETFCPSTNNPIVGFKVRDESPPFVGAAGEYSALNSIDMYCSQFSEVLQRFGGYVKDQELSTHPGIWGDWMPRQFCPKGKAVNGIQTQVQTYQGPGHKDGNDDTAMNGIRLFCSDYP